MPGKEWFTLLRLYSPKESFFDKSWRLSETELVKLLTKEKARPLKRKGLEGKVKSWFPGLEAEMRLALLQRLFDTSHVRESDNSLSYHL